MMYKKILSILISVVLILICFASCGDNVSPITKDVENLKLLRGLNLSGLEYRHRPLFYIDRKSVYEDIAQQGFDHVRVPVDFRIYFNNEKGEFKKSFLNRLDNIINMANHEGLAVMLDFHGWSNFNVANGDTELFLSIWEKVAEHYKDYSNMLLFELINEPHTTEGGDLNMTNLMELQCKAIEKIRVISPDRTIVVATAEWNGTWTLKDFNPPAYDNLILAVHCYEPMDFTHQGQWWAGRAGTKESLTDEMLLGLYEHLDRIKEFKERTGMEVVLNEFGAITTGIISDDDLYRFVSVITKYAEKNGFGWTYWEYNKEFGAYKKGFLGIGGEWREVMLDALFLRERKGE